MNLRSGPQVHCFSFHPRSRGRVGRSGREGFTYLFYTDKSLLFRIDMGALDGGLGIPHSGKRFAGFKKDKKQLGAEIHRKYIYEGHVADYMKLMRNLRSTNLTSVSTSGRILRPMTWKHCIRKVHAAICAYLTMARSTKEPPKTHKSWIYLAVY
ncbi:hypothetical protein ACQJBY_037455 [Aegilops geniculata]